MEKKGNLNKPRQRLRVLDVGWPGDNPGDLEKWTAAASRKEEGAGISGECHPCS